MCPLGKVKINKGEKLKMKNNNNSVMRAILGLLVVIVTFFVSLVHVYAIPPDVINSYVVTIEPLPTGQLRITEEISYCAATDFPSGDAWLEIGVPNKSFELVEYGPDNWIVGASKKTSGGSWVHLDFAHLPLAGECFTFYFTIQQDRMAHRQGDNVSFHFRPAWFDFAEIKELTIRWQVPDVEPSSAQPASSIEDGYVTWQTGNLGTNQKFTVDITFPISAFPQLPEEAAQPAPVTSSGGSGGLICGMSFVTLAIIVIVVILVLLLLWVLVESDSSSSYSSGSYVGGYSGSSSISKSSVGSRSPSKSSSRSSGGGGSYGGRASSCACACACAGSGRAGCGKGFGIHSLFHLRVRHGNETQS